MTMRVSLPAIESAGVIPVESPTVPKAETTSKIASLKVKSSTTSRTSVPPNTTSIPIATTASASRTSQSGTSRLKNSTRPVPLNMDLIEASARPTVTVLTPPAVPPGDPPMNIRAASMKSVGSASEAVRTVLNPAVRAVTEPKYEVSSLAPNGFPASVPSHSSAMKESVPMRSSDIVMMTTSLT